VSITPPSHQAASRLHLVRPGKSNHEAAARRPPKRHRPEPLVVSTLAAYPADFGAHKPLGSKLETRKTTESRPDTAFLGFSGSAYRPPGERITCHPTAAVDAYPATPTGNGTANTRAFSGIAF